MLRANRPILAFFDSIKALRVRQLALILKAGYDPNLMLNARGQNGLQFMINYFGATDAHYRLQAPINKSAYLSIAKLLLDSGLDPNAMDLLTDETVLFDAIRYNDREMVALLLNYVDLSLRNKSGETALMCAARFGSKQVTRLILEHLRHLEMDSYFLRQRNRFGLTPLEIARSENIEAAKVLTKHLIAYGSPAAGAMLARSVSHHQLVAAGAAAVGADYAAYRPPPAVAAVAGHLHMRNHHRRHHHAAAAELLVADDCLSPSDYDSDTLVAPAPGPAPRPQNRRQTATMLGAGYHQAYYDPKAAEFNQYLLEQQAAMDSGEPMGGGGGGGGGGRGAGGAYGPGASSGRGRGARALSEEEDYVGAAGGPLIRSRSCMLGPSAGASSKGAYGPGAKKGAGDSVSKMANAWQDASGGGAGGGAGQ